LRGSNEPRNRYKKLAAAASVAAVVVIVVVATAAANNQQDDDNATARISAKTVSKHRYTPFRRCATAKNKPNVDILLFCAVFCINFFNKSRIF